MELDHESNITTHFNVLHSENSSTDCFCNTNSDVSTTHFNVLHSENSSTDCFCNTSNSDVSNVDVNCLIHEARLSTTILNECTSTDQTTMLPSADISTCINNVGVNGLIHENHLSSNNSHECISSDLTTVLPSCDNSTHIHTVKDTDNQISFKPWFNTKGLKIVHLNIHYLYPKLDEIKLILSQQDIDILCLCETFLNETFLTIEMQIENFKMFRKDRQTNGGGLVIYVRDELHCLQRTDLENISVESIWLEIKQPNSKSFLISYVYRPPSSKVQWVKDFTLMLDNSLSDEKECIVLGDFNFDLLKIDSPSKSWLDLMESVNFKQLVKDPTRVTLNSATLIDHAFSNTPQNMSSVTVPIYAISDHYPVCITRKVPPNYIKGPVHKIITYRSLKRFDDRQFIDELSVQPWFLIDQYDNPDDSVELFLKLFKSVLSKHAPQRKRRVKRVNQPNWMKQEILDAIKLRNHFHKNSDTINYKIWRQNVKNLIIEAKQQFYN